MEKLRQASIRELEAAAQADDFREQVGTIRAEIEQLRSEQKVAATAEAVPPTPDDMLAACGTMQQALEGLYATPGLPAVVLESKAAAAAAFIEMAATAQKLAGFEATVRAAMAANQAPSPPAPGEAGGAATPDAEPKEGGAEGTAEAKVAEAQSGGGGGTEASPAETASSRSCRH